ncbi:MAG: hypothetical protein HY748_02925 [Elusimicrobia bacterium]|nr:hypothetical protein [Elusimicrobiota bacterium]
MMNIVLAAAFLAIQPVLVRTASADQEGWATLAAAQASALPGFFDGVRLPGGPSSPVALPGLPVFRAAPPEGIPAAGIPFNGATLPRAVFSGQESVSGHLVRAVDATQGGLKLMLYDFSLQDVWDALERAVSRSPAVEVMVILDQGHVFPRAGRKPNAIIVKLVADPRIKTRIVAGLGDYGLMHNKIAIFDGKLVKTGSFNWSKAAQMSNHENAVFSDETARVAAFSAYWDWVWAHAYPPDAPRPPPELAGNPPEDPSPGVSFHSARFPVAVFSPKGGAAERILSAIGCSRSTIDVAMFSFTSRALAEALWERVQAGVRVRVLLDRKQSRSPYSVLPYLREKGMEVAIIDGRTKAGVLHDKYGIFDGLLVGTGSYNWTTNGEFYSFENAAFLADPADVSSFKADFERLWGLGRKD